MKIKKHKNQYLKVHLYSTAGAFFPKNVQKIMTYLKFYKQTQKNRY